VLKLGRDIVAEHRRLMEHVIARAPKCLQLPADHTRQAVIATVTDKAE
jgi:hypothetical protein